MVTIIKPEPPGAADWVADRFIFLDKHGNVVGEKDPNKLTQLVAKGCTLPRAVAERYGLLTPPAPAVETPAVIAEPEAPVILAIEPEMEPPPDEPGQEPEPVKTEVIKKHHRKR